MSAALAEASRRHRSAVLVVFDTPALGSYALSRQAGANVTCYRTGDMSDAQLVQVIGELGRMTPGGRNDQGGLSLASAVIAPPFDFKGDALGMSLAQFTARHSRMVGKIALPYTSESTRGHANSALWSEAWHAAANIVHARIDLPAENNSPTVAGVKTELFVYQFVDGLLFRMTGLFVTEAFHVVRAAYAEKHGTPTKVHDDPAEFVWDNGVSAIHLVRGTMRPKRSSMVIYTHNDLVVRAERRTPQRTGDL
jgi:hypothetical protein